MRRRRAAASCSSSCRTSWPRTCSRTRRGRARRSDSYERLAFLGDSVLALAVTAHLYPRLEAERFGAGRLTKIRAQAVSGRSCRAVAERLGVPGAAAGGGAAGARPRRVEALIATERVLASVIEAVIGACYLAFGYEPTAEAVVEAFAPEIEDALEHPVDFKSALQERLARRGELVSYAVVDEQGPPHDRTFSVSAQIERRRGRPGDRAAARRTPSRRPRRRRSRRSSDDRRQRRGGRVYLKSITLKGFKSFPDRTRLEFGPGVSVIVGPNGSGKSNVTDAVLWALGEQSPVAVRGQSMQDVIFGGAPGRQAGKSAEVELVLDDSEGALGLGTPEVSIVRRLDRAGEGEYRLAGARCRLVDVIELLSDTGLGKEMHSVISQGRVEAIVTSKPRDRRLLIEEAAGLGKHRKRRRRAQLKLDAHPGQPRPRARRRARGALAAAAAQAPGRGGRAPRPARAPDARGALGAGPRRAPRPRRRALAERRRRPPPRRARGARSSSAELEEVGTRREAAEEALAAPQRPARGALAPLRSPPQSAAERVGYRTEAVQAPPADVERAAERGRGRRSARCSAEAAADAPDTEAAPGSRRSSGAGRARPRPRGRARPPARRARARSSRPPRAEAERAAARRRSRPERAREAAEQRLERGARPALRDAERAVEAARREAARVGGELAAVNQFLRSQAASPGGAASLADELEVDPGYELARRGGARRPARRGGGRRPRRPPRRCSTGPAPTAAGRCRLGRRRRRRGPPGGAPGAGARAPSGSPTRPRRERGRVAGRGRCCADAWVVDALDDAPAGLRRRRGHPRRAGVVGRRAASSARPPPSARSGCSPSATAARS